MSTLQARIQDDVKAAMKAGRKEELEVLRMLLADVKNAAIASHADRSAVSDEAVLAVVRRGVKTRSESLETYREAGRADLADRESFQIKVLKRYLPAEISSAEIEVIVDTVIVELGAETKRDMGRVMKAVMARVGGRAEGKVVSGIVASRLG